MKANTKNPGDDVGKEKLLEDLRMVVADAEQLLHATAGQAGDKVSAARERIEGSIAATKRRIVEVEEAAVASAKQAAKATDAYVHENPWRAVGIAAGVGLVVGMLISRGR